MDSSNNSRADSNLPQQVRKRRLNLFSSRLFVFIALSFLVLVNFLEQDMSTHLPLPIEVNPNSRRRFTLYNNYNAPRTTTSPLFKSMDDAVDFSTLHNVTLMHVGKTGGSTLRTYVFRISCTAIANKDKKLSCLETITPNETVLSKRTTGFVHYDHVHPDEILETSNVYLFTIRDPVARFISLFRFHSPQNCFPELGAKYGCLMRKRIQRHPDIPEAKYYAYCFPTLPHIFAGLKDPLLFQPANTSQVNASECIQLLQEGFHLANATSIYGHLEANYRYYWGLIKRPLDVKTILAVRTEFLWEDTSKLDRLIGGSGEFAGLESKKVTHGSEAYIDPSNSTSDVTPPSDADYRLLCCALWPDMVAYRQIVDNSVNLSPLDKEETFKITFDQCGVTSWVQLQEYCLATHSTSPFWKPLLLEEVFPLHVQNS